MYEKFYGFIEKPFNVTPDPRFLYLGERHREALAHLIYGVREKKGFIVLTGEVGAGKTTLIHTLIERLDSSVKTALIFNSNITLKELFLFILDEFELKAKFQTKADFLIKLNDFLIERLKRNENTVLIIDEAQNLSPLILEEIRLLLNLETSKNKLLQIILSGQPELNHKLNLPKLRQLKQRISIRYHLPPLTAAETKEYIRERLGIAGSQNSSIFTQKAMEEIFKYSKGIPRVINILCDNSLLIGYATNQPKIVPKIVKESIRDLELGSVSKEMNVITTPKVSRNPFKRRAWRLAFALVFLSFIFIGELWWNPEIFKSTKVIFRPSEARLEEKKISQFLQAKAIITPKSSIQKAEFPSSIVMDQEVLVEKTDLPDLPNHRKFSEKEGTKSSQTITVAKGDILSRIVLKRYGMVNKKILNFIKSVNSGIRNVDHIEIGQRIFLPEIDRDIDFGQMHSDLFSVHVASFQKFADAYTLFSLLVREKYEVYVIPVHIPQKGQWYRGSLGRFKGEDEALIYSKRLLKNGKFDYAQPLNIMISKALEIEK
jgi:general secretion pathway protein A